MNHKESGTGKSGPDWPRNDACPCEFSFVCDVISLNVCVCVCVCDSARTSTGPIIMQNSSKLMTPVPLTSNLCHAFTRNCMHPMLESCLEFKFCGRKASMVNVDCQCLCCHVAAYEFLKDTRTRTPKTQPVSRCAVVYEDLYFCQDPIVTLARFRGSATRVARV